MDYKELMQLKNEYDKHRLAMRLGKLYASYKKNRNTLNYYVPEWDKKISEEIINNMSTNPKVRVLKRYSKKFQTVEIEMETTAQTFNEDILWLDDKMTQEMNNIPQFLFDDVDSRETKPQYNNKPSGGYKKPYTPQQVAAKAPQQKGGFKPQGAQGNEKQWKIIFDERNTHKLVNAGLLDEENNVLFDINDYQAVSSAVSVALGK